MKDIRKIAGKTPFLISGIGEQGGDIVASVLFGDNGEGMIISASRSIISASKSEDFPEAARKAAKELNEKVNAVKSLA